MKCFVGPDLLFYQISWGGGMECNNIVYSLGPGVSGWKNGMYLYSMLSRTRSIGVGGWNVSEYLKQAMSWQETTESGTATVSSLDTTGKLNKKNLTMRSLNWKPCSNIPSWFCYILIHFSQDVKEKCRLSLNLCREEQRNAYRTETLSIRSQGRGLRGGGAHHHIPAVSFFELIHLICN